MSLCISPDKITHDFAVRDFFGKTTSSSYITVNKTMHGVCKYANSAFSFLITTTSNFTRSAVTKCLWHPVPILEILHN